jgi:Rha family phage regulatory protein
MNELVTVSGSHAVTTSLKVAEVFGKRHDNVIQAIQRLECSENFRLLNFQESSTRQSMPNGGVKEIPAYQITKDGFAFLAMGFTGKKAAQFKEAYIQAFNEKEAALKEVIASGAITIDTIIAALRPVIHENEVMRHRLEFAVNFLPQGKPGDRNDNGQPKTQFRRGYYTAGNGRSVTALIEHPTLPGLFEQIELQKLRPLNTSLNFPNCKLGM